MAKKKRTEKEDLSINFKLSKELKSKIIDLAKKDGKTISNYLRGHFENFIDGSLFEEEFTFDQEQKFMFSEEFMQLIIWMYSKRKQKECEETEFELNGYIDTLKKINYEFPYSIKKDFEKVLQDVLKVRNETGLIKKFTFSKKEEDELSFSFKRFENYLLKGETEKSYIGVGR